MTINTVSKHVRLKMYVVHYVFVKKNPSVQWELWKSKPSTNNGGREADRRRGKSERPGRETGDDVKIGPQNGPLTGENCEQYGRRKRADNEKKTVEKRYGTRKNFQHAYARQNSSVSHSATPFVVHARHASTAANTTRTSATTAGRWEKDACRQTRRRTTHHFEVGFGFARR